MVNEISNVGLMPAKGLGYTVGVPSEQNRSAEGVPSEKSYAADQQVARHVGFSTLANAKDDSARLAQSVRRTEQEMQQAAGLVKEMSQDVETILKNYPPFPPGNEQRLSYLNSVAGLRRQLESMTIPPVQDGAQYVFYPQEVDLPELDPKTATDEELQLFSNELDKTREKIAEGLAELRTQADLLPRKINDDLPMPIPSESEATQIGNEVASRLSGNSLPIVTGSDALAQIGI